MLAKVLKYFWIFQKSFSELKFWLSFTCRSWFFWKLGRICYPWVNKLFTFLYYNIKRYNQNVMKRRSAGVLIGTSVMSAEMFKKLSFFFSSFFVVWFSHKIFINFSGKDFRNERSFLEFSKPSSVGHPYYRFFSLLCRQKHFFFLLCQIIFRLSNPPASISPSSQSHIVKREFNEGMEIFLRDFIDFIGAGYLFGDYQVHFRFWIKVRKLNLKRLIFLYLKLSLKIYFLFLTTLFELKWEKLISNK